MVEVPPVPPFNPENVPAELKAKRQWINWRYGVRDGKMTKVPIAPWATGDLSAIDVTDPNFCTDFQTAADAARKHSVGLGFAFFKGAGIVGIDLDKLEQLGGEAKEIIRKANSYAEYSPSGKGVHILGRGKLEKAIKKVGLEVYSHDRFFTVTGNRLEGTPPELNDIQPLLEELEGKYGDKPRTAAIAVAKQPV